MALFTSNAISYKTYLVEVIFWVAAAAAAKAAIPVIDACVVLAEDTGTEEERRGVVLTNDAAEVVFA